MIKLDDKKLVIGGREFEIKGDAYDKIYIAILFARTLGKSTIEIYGKIYNVRVLEMLLYDARGRSVKEFIDKYEKLMLSMEKSVENIEYY